MEFKFEQLHEKWPIKMIAACTVKGGIGNENGLPWRLKTDMKFFSRITKSTTNQNLYNAVVMGRKTFESMKSSPLEGRINVVISKNLRRKIHDGINLIIVSSLDEVAEKLLSEGIRDKIETIFIIGGAQIYTQALTKLQVSTIYLTMVTGPDIKCDTDCEALIQLEQHHLTYISKTYVENGFSLTFNMYNHQSSLQSISEPRKSEFQLAIEYATDMGLSNHNVSTFEPQLLCFPYAYPRDHPEFQYLDLITDVINNGRPINDRTGVGILYKAGAIMRFDLRASFPLLTTKSVFWRGVAEELLWFIRGDTNANHLTNKGIKIWEKNGSREFLDSRKLHQNAAGDLGPVYGFQWRHFGADYKDFNTDYTGLGVDQLKKCIHQIKNEPSSRRIIISAWNAADIDKMALPPCHVLCQFIVCEGKLSCVLYQRSADLGLGVPFNIASYSLLCRLVAQVTDLEANEFIHVIGHAHVYKNHIEPLKRQLLRCPRPFPTLHIDSSIRVK